MNTIGNIELLSQPATGFLCSRTVASKAILPCLEWAVEVAKDEQACIMSTFHSPVEKEVLTFLLQGKCKIILILARSLYKQIPQEFNHALENNRLLILSIRNQSRISKDSAQQANQYICSNASPLIFGFISPGSSLEKMFKDAEKETKLLTKQ